MWMTLFLEEDDLFSTVACQIKIEALAYALCKQQASRDRQGLQEEFRSHGLCNKNFVKHSE